MVSVKLQYTIKETQKAAINKSSNLATNLETWESFARANNYAHFAQIDRKGDLITYIEFNYFNGYKWTNLILE